MRFAVGVLLLPVFLGCAIDPVEKIEDDLAARDPAIRGAAVESAGRCGDPASLGLLIEPFEADPELLDPAAHALILRGRRWDKAHPRHRWDKGNPVIAAVGATAAKAHLEPEVRARACFVLGEIGSRKAKPFLLAAYGGDSMAVQREQARARDKLGFTNNAVAFEVLR